MSRPVESRPVAPPDPRQRFALGHWLFLRLLGISTLAAFASLHVQVVGLFGEGGIAPLGARLDRWRLLGADPPTLLRLTGASDAALGGLCAAGELAAALLALGVVPGPAAVACFVLYLSFVSVGAPFLPLQWDTLLLETLALAAVAAPWSEAVSSPRRAREPIPVTRWALWFLLARLLLASGLVKFLGGDPVWRDLTALAYHYETQPLPSPVSPWAHALPMPVHVLGAIFTFVAEIPVPPLVFGPRPPRLAAALVSLLLQLLITLTGNFGFFNLLTASLCVPLLDDAALLCLAPGPLRGRAGWRPRRTGWRAVLPSALATLLASLGLLQFGTSMGARASDEVLALLDAQAPYGLTSSYGLFADMTTARPVLVFEGSEDGARWVPYELRYGPGDPDRGLPLCTPHMPRLDWMLWFAALGGPRDSPWVWSVAEGLLERRAPVLGLLDHDPFAGRAPRYVRVVRRQYRLAPPGTAHVWERTEPEPWGPVLRAR